VLRVCEELERLRAHGVAVAPLCAGIAKLRKSRSQYARIASATGTVD
jgi:hypothetical protein